MHAAPTPAAAVECMPTPLPASALAADIRQMFYTYYSSVADTNTHKKSRGYGIVLAVVPPPPGEDGPERLQVKFENGTRTTTLQPSSLDLSVIHHEHMRQPTALQQRVLVNVGAGKGETGVTEAKVGAAAAGGAAARIKAAASLASTQLHCSPDSACPAPAAAWSPLDCPAGRARAPGVLPHVAPACAGGSGPGQSNAAI